MNYNTVVLSYANNLPQFIIHDYKIPLIIFSSVILGEAINAFTAWLTRISPIRLSLSDKFKLLFKKGPIHIWVENTPWPLWINIASFPVSFAVFDRYYLGTLDEDRKALAGRIGWTAFYRNCGLVFVLISLLQFPSMVSSIQSLFYEDPLYHKAPLSPSTWFGEVSSPHIYYINNLIFGLEILLPYLFPIGLIPLFIIAYLAQISSNKKIFWNAYRRNELRKILEAKHGDVPLALGIKEEYRKKAYDYILDRWFHAAEMAVKDLSRHLITKAEYLYNDKMNRIDSKHITLSALKNLSGKQIAYSFFHLKSRSPEQTFKTELNTLIVEAYKEFYIGNYEITMSHAISILNGLYKLEDSNLLEYDEFWKTIKGHYIIAFTLRTEAAYQEIIHNVKKWKWMIGDSANSDDVNDENKFENSEDKNIIYDEDSIDAHYSKDAHMSDKFAQLVWESADEYHRSFIIIRKVIEKLNHYKESNLIGYSVFDLTQHKYFKKMEAIYTKLGGHDYFGATQDAYRLYNLIPNP